MGYLHQQQASAEHLTMNHSLSQAYLSLPLGDRQAALDGLVRSLWPNDCTYMRNLLLEPRDPVTALPPEVLLRVFDFLHPFTLWRLRTVCTSWNAFLSSERVVETQLVRLESCDRTELSRTTHIAFAPTQRSRIRKIQALRLVRPFTFTEDKDQLAIPLGSTEFLKSMPAYSLRGDRIAYLRFASYRSNIVVLRNVVSQETRSFRGDAGEKLVGLALGHKLLVYANFDGTMYVVDLAQADNISHVRLPSSNLRSVAVDGSVVAALLRNSLEESTILLYDHGLKRTTTFTFAHLAADSVNGSWMPAQTLRLDAKAGMVDVFGAAWGTLRPAQSYRVVPVYVAHLRLSMIGEQVCGSVLKGKNAELLLYTRRDGESQHMSVQLGAVQETGRRHIFCIDLETHDRSPDKGRKHIFFFDAATAALSEIDTMLPGSFGASNNEDSSPVLWRDCAYVSEANGEISTARLSRPVLLHSAIVGQISPRRPGPMQAGYSASCRSRPRAMVMNDSFLVRFSPKDGKILVMCFDESINMAGAKSTGLWPELDTGPQIPLFQRKVYQFGRGRSNHADGGFDDRSAQHWPSERTLYRCMPFCDPCHLRYMDEEEGSGMEDVDSDLYELDAEILGDLF